MLSSVCSVETTFSNYLTNRFHVASHLFNNRSKIMSKGGNRNVVRFCCLRFDSQRTTNKARYNAICVQECLNFNTWGYGLCSKCSAGSKLYCKTMIGLQATKRWGFERHRKNCSAPGLQPPPLWDSAN